MLNFLILFPVLSGACVLALPRSRPALARRVAFGSSLVTLAAALLLWHGFDSSSAALQARTTLPWIPSLGAAYDVAIDGLSLAMVVLTALLTCVVMLYVLPQHEHGPRLHAFLFLLLESGLIGVFTARDLLLFYVFFEIGLVPMYFIIGIWGGPQRRYASLKFILYTRVGSLAMLLGFLALYLSMTPHTFSLPAIIHAQPLAHAPGAGRFVFFALLLGFAVKLPAVPLHNWLPDAHVEAPTEGSVVLAGLQLKMGAYGLIAILLPVVPGMTAHFGGLLVAIALVSLFYGAIVALAQTDAKRLIAYTSVNHMAYVLLAVAVAAMSGATAGQLAINGAIVQMVSHGLLTGGMFLVVGMLSHRVGSRELSRLGGTLENLPLYGGLFGLLAFGSLGLPGFSGFIAEFQVIAASLALGYWVAGLVALSLIVTTGLYLYLFGRVVLGAAPDGMPVLAPLAIRELWAAGILTACSIAIGIVPGSIMPAVATTASQIVAAPRGQ